MMGLPGGAGQDKVTSARADVARLRLEGKTVREIAAALGISVGAASGHLKAVRREWRTRTTEDYGQLVADETARLDAVEQVLWPRIMAGALPAIDRWLGVSRQRAMILGLGEQKKGNDLGDVLAGVLARLAGEARSPDADA